MTKQQRKARKNQRERERRHLVHLAAAEQKGREQGRKDGGQVGVDHVRAAVLSHAGELYMQGRDVEAHAVREAYRQLPTKL